MNLELKFTTDDGNSVPEYSGLDEDTGEYY